MKIKFLAIFEDSVLYPESFLTFNERDGHWACCVPNTYEFWWKYSRRNFFGSELYKGVSFLLDGLQESKRLFKRLGFWLKKKSGNLCFDSCRLWKGQKKRMSDLLLSLEVYLFHRIEFRNFFAQLQKLDPNFGSFRNGVIFTWKRIFWNIPLKDIRNQFPC